MPSEKILQKIDAIRRSGYRPCVIAALICDGKLGLFKGKYPGYEFVQGGIEFGETPKDATEREVMEEIGYWFYQGCHFPPKKFSYILEAKMDTRVKDKLLTTEGETIKAKGKHYLVFAAILDTNERPTINIEDSKYKGSLVKFHSCVWADYDKAKNLVQSITNPIKRDIAIKAIEMIKARKLI